MKVKLIAIGGKKAGMEIPITTPTFLIGRDEKCHLRPECKFVNHVHCQISVDKGSVVVDDCSGAIGTFVNGEKVKWRHVLKNGDRIKVGTLELEVRFTANEKDEKKPIPKAREVAGSAVVAAAINGQEAEILKWVEGKSEKPKEAKQNATLAANLAATSVNKTPGVALVAPAIQGRQPGQARAGEMEIEYEGADLLLAATIGIMLIVVLCMVWPMIPWPHWHWHPVHWYWIRAVWYWSNLSWFRWITSATFLALLTLLLGIRTWRQRARQ